MHLQIWVRAAVLNLRPIPPVTPGRLRRGRLLFEKYRSRVKAPSRRGQCLPKGGAGRPGAFGPATALSPSGLLHCRVHRVAPRGYRSHSSTGQALLPHLGRDRGWSWRQPRARRATREG